MAVGPIDCQADLFCCSSILTPPFKHSLATVCNVSCGDKKNRVGHESCIVSCCEAFAARLAILWNAWTETGTDSGYAVIDGSIRTRVNAKFDASVELMSN